MKAARASLTDRAQAETIFREFGQLQTRYVPYLVWQRGPFRGETITVGEDGNRHHAPTTDQPIGHVRLFGGSTIWGKGVDNEHSIPAQFNRLHPRFAVQLMEAAAVAEPRVLRTPNPPQALLARFADSGIELELGVWINDPENDQLNLKSALNRAIWQSFRENGIRIPFPQREIRILADAGGDARASV